MTPTSRFNVQGALNRLMNNTTLYEKLLSTMLERYHDLDTQLTDMLRKGNYEKAFFQLHTLKGLAGNAGAEYLQKECQNMEQLCKNSVPFEEIQPNLEIFLNELRLALKEIEEGIEI
ncbi:MAG: Hpt domain-containing protein [Desulfobulbus sp.]|jgi:two-component system sensor histidine kinase/response regulator